MEAPAPTSWALKQPMFKKSGDKNKAWCHWQRIIYHPVFNNVIEQKQVWYRQYGFKIISLRTIELPIGHWKIMRPTSSIRREEIQRTFVWLFPTAIKCASRNTTLENQILKNQTEGKSGIEKQTGENQALKNRPGKICQRSCVFEIIV